jgi:predicted ribosome quality control (RQC) complex YloA/Tae2 family protein
VEGLLIAEALGPLQARLPSERLSWRFPDAYTFVLPLEREALWLYLKPPRPLLGLTKEFPSATGSHSSFQALLAARAVGPLLGIAQRKLDRVVDLEFGPSRGFVDHPGVRLVAELTGRNANLVLLDEAGTILGVMREVRSGMSRRRELRPGLEYIGPPPYEKLDPRAAGDEELRKALAGQKLKDLHKGIDGLGPELTRALAHRLGVTINARIDGALLPEALGALRELAAAPRAVLARVEALLEVHGLREEEARHELLARLQALLAKDIAKLERRLEDIVRAGEAAAEADFLRHRADLLMAHAHALPERAATVTVEDFEGRALTLELDPKLSVIDNAQALYRRARKRETGLEAARAREARLQAELIELRGKLESLHSRPEAELRALAEAYERRDGEARRTVGARHVSPQGYIILVGRSAKENDLLTMKLAKSQDVWLHAQGYEGAHVIVQAQGKEVPFETVLFAAELAAAFSRAGESSNVPVDYTLRKHVWKPKGASPGAVHYSQQKTVYVTPRKHRRPAELR